MGRERRVLPILNVYTAYMGLEWNRGGLSTSWANRRWLRVGGTTGIRRRAEHDVNIREDNVAVG